MTIVIDIWGVERVRGHVVVRDVALEEGGYGSQTRQRHSKLKSGASPGTIFADLV